VATAGIPNADSCALLFASHAVAGDLVGGSSLESQPQGGRHLASQPTRPQTLGPKPANSLNQALKIAWEHFDILLQQVISGVSIPSDSWAEFASVLASYRLWKTRDRAAARRVAAQTAGPLGQALDRWYGHLEHRTGRAVHMAGR
jgi:hypothetical protein